MTTPTREYPFEHIPLGIGYYTVFEAARLLKERPRNIRRWLGGYTYRTDRGEEVKIPPLWTPELPAFEEHVELGFRDLIELRFIYMDASTTNASGDPLRIPVKSIEGSPAAFRHSISRSHRPKPM
jgi:hypothetical protein